MRKQHQEKVVKHQEELEKLRKENDGLKRELLTSNPKDTCTLLVHNYEKIRGQNCDLTLELVGGKTLGVHKAILMGK
jgi:hypothetical protein